MDTSLNAIGLQSLATGKLAALKAKMAESRPEAAKSALTPEMEAQFKDVGQQFESMFLSEMLSHVSSGIETDQNFGGGQGEQMFKSLLTEQYAKEVSKRGGIGIAPAIENYLKVQQLASQEIKP